MKKTASALLDQRTILRSIHDGDEPVDREVYDEYARGFDDIPILDDAVIIPPRPRLPPSFVDGERRSLRKQERPDGFDLRQAKLDELEELYREYLSTQPLRRKRKTVAHPSKPTRRQKRRPKRAAG
jgi:hypothetical protein